jgi:hypothetical protein
MAGKVWRARQFEQRRVRRDAAAVCGNREVAKPAEHLTRRREAAKSSDSDHKSPITNHEARPA